MQHHEKKKNTKIVLKNQEYNSFKSFDSKNNSNYIKFKIISHSLQF